MKRICSILIFLASVTLLSSSESKRHGELEKEIQGEWLAAEYFIAQPPPELQQSIKSMSFGSKNLVEWEYVQDGKVHKGKGRYGIYSSATDQKMPEQLPSLIIVPLNYPEGLLSNRILLTLSRIELDFDSRFIRSWGRLIKAEAPDGKRVMFIRKFR